MANWCKNNVSIECPSEDMAKQLVMAVIRESMKDDFEGLPAVGDIGGPGLERWELDSCSVELWFDSRWEPPIELYEYLFKRGYGVEAVYCEPDMEIWGGFSNGVHEGHDGPVEAANSDVIECLGLDYLLTDELEDD